MSSKSRPRYSNQTKALAMHPYHISCPGDHVFCADCLEDHCNSAISVQHGVRCATCRAKVTEKGFRKGDFIRRQIDRLIVKCVNSHCSFTGPQGDYHKHKCLFRPVKCYTRACSWKGIARDRDAHTRVCPFGETRCNRRGCKVVYIRNQFGAHDQLCKFFSCNQKYSREKKCNFVGTKKQVRTEHAPYCTWLHSKIAELENNQIKAAQDKKARIPLPPLKQLQVKQPQVKQPQVKQPQVKQPLVEQHQVEQPQIAPIDQAMANSTEFTHYSDCGELMKAQAKSVAEGKAAEVAETSFVVKGAKKRSAVIAFPPELPEAGPIASTSKLPPLKKPAPIATRSSARQRTASLSLPPIVEASGSIVLN